APRGSPGGRRSGPGPRPGGRRGPSSPCAQAAFARSCAGTGPRRGRRRRRSAGACRRPAARAPPAAPAPRRSRPGGFGPHVPRTIDRMPMGHSKTFCLRRQEEASGFGEVSSLTPASRERALIEVASVSMIPRRGVVADATDALIFAELPGVWTEWKQALEGWNVRESQQVLEWQAEAELRNQRANLLRALEKRRQAPVPSDLAEAIQATQD